MCYEVVLLATAVTCRWFKYILFSISLTPNIINKVNGIGMKAKCLLNFFLLLIEFVFTQMIFWNYLNLPTVKLATLKITVEILSDVT